MRRLIIVMLLLAAVLLPGGVASANSAPPPASAWLEFDVASPLRGAQAIQCEDAACARAVRVAQAGVCDAPVCRVPSPDPSQWTLQLGCDARTCLLMGYVGGRPTLTTTIVAQFADGSAVSAPLAFAAGYGSQSAWRLTRDGQVLQAAPLQGYRPPLTHYLDQWTTAFLVTLIIELAVAALMLVVLGIRGRLWWQSLLFVLLANLFTHPIVWFVIPSQARWFPADLRGTVAGILMIALAYLAALLAIRFATSRRARSLAITLGAVAIVAALGCALVAAFAGAYGAYGRNMTSGASLEATLVAAELFAFLAETGLIWLLTRGELTLWKAALISVVMNAASFVIGAMVIR